MPLKKEDEITKLREISGTEGLNLTDDGVNAISELAKGDMRKCLNIMQSCSMAFPEINEENVYTSVGAPKPQLIDDMISTLLTGTFVECNDSLARLKMGLNLSDLVNQIHLQIIKIDWPDQMKMFIVKRLAEIEWRLSIGANEKLQTAALIGGFIEARQLPS
jgi:replication factor C subunit 3/5